MEKVINSFMVSRVLARPIDLLSRSKLNWKDGQSGLDLWLDGYSCFLTIAQRPAVQQPVCELSSMTISHTESWESMEEYFQHPRIFLLMQSR